MDFIQWTSFILSVLTFILVLVWMKKNPSLSLYGVSVVIYLSHLIIFYLLVCVNRNLFDTGIDYTQWSRYVRFHAIFTLFSTFLILTNIFQGIISYFDRIKNHWKNQ